LIVLVVRGFNTNDETNTILVENDIPKMKFSKFMNNVVLEWHLAKKNGQVIEKKSIVTNLGIEL